MKNRIEPYRVLFPIGTAYALAGVLLWLLVAWLPNNPYPGPAHSKIMIGGFLVAFVMGFLMTAIPKMTASFPAAPWEIGSAAGIVILTGLLAITNFESLYYASVFASFLFLIMFGLRRLSARTKAVPDFFVFVASGLFSGLIGSFLMLVFPDHVLGRLLLIQGMLFSLVLGVGCRLVPLICGLAPVEKAGRWKFVIAASLLWVSFGMDSAGQMMPANFLRAVVASWVGIYHWQLFSWPRTDSRLAYLIKASGMMVLAGPWLAGWQPPLAMHWMHLTYVGGFGLMTFMVASRVTLAHGSFDLGFEARCKSVYWIGGLILVAAVTRAAAPLIENRYLSHLQYAAALWVLGVLLWAWVFVRKMIKLGELEKPAC